MKTILLLPLLALCFACAAVLYAQPAPIKWGVVPEEHLEMRAFPADTSAAAVILADYGTIRFNQDYSLIFERHRRIKILTEAGYAWGTFSIPYVAEDRMQTVAAVQGQTILLGPDGKVQRHKMDKKSIFREDVDGRWKRVRFTLPALAPGAVIEYSYQVVSQNPVLLPEWQFQASEPTLWSEYVVEVPSRLRYIRATRGLLNFHIEDAQKALGLWGEGMLHRWVMRDVPALREEPFMTTPNDFRASMRFQLHSYYDPDYLRTVEILNTWEELARELMDLSSFGKQLRRQGAIRDQAALLTAGVEDPLEKLRRLYDYVRTTIRWNGEAGYLLDQELRQVLKTQRGSSPEIALLLVALLREAGLEAHPVLISTRSHGSIIEVYPLLTQFNDVLVYARVGEAVYLLDATDPLRPHDLLPYEALNGKGWLVHEKGAQWIPIQAQGRYRHQVRLTGELDAAGTLTAQLQSSDGGYSALEKRHELEEQKDRQSYLRDVVLEELGDVQLISSVIHHEKEVDEVLKIEAAFSVDGFAMPTGDFIYFNPVLVGRLQENPLRLPERTFPVDLGYPREQHYTLQLELPPGYVVQEMPGNVRLSLPSGSGLYQRAFEVKEGLLIVQHRLLFTQAVFEPQHYQDLRAFFAAVVAAQAEQVVLKRGERLVHDDQADGEEK